MNSCNKWNDKLPSPHESLLRCKYSGPQLKCSWRWKTQNDRRLGTEVYFTYYKNSMGRIMQHITSHDAVVTKMRTTMARMTGATTQPVLISPCTLRLICLPCAYIRSIHLGARGNIMGRKKIIIYQCYVNWLRCWRWWRHAAAKLQSWPLPPSPPLPRYRHRRAIAAAASSPPPCCRDAHRPRPAATLPPSPPQPRCHRCQPPPTPPEVNKKNIFDVVGK